MVGMVGGGSLQLKGQDSGSIKFQKKAFWEKLVIEAYNTCGSKLVTHASRHWKTQHGLTSVIRRESVYSVVVWSLAHIVAT